LFKTPRPRNVYKSISDLVTHELWSASLLHFYISCPLTSSFNKDCRKATFLADTVNLFLNNSANLHRTLLGQLPLDMKRELELLVLLRHSPFCSSGYILVPKALKIIFSEGFLERRVVLTALE
jgi:hypothetical protein